MAQAAPVRSVARFRRLLKIPSLGEGTASPAVNTAQARQLLDDLMSRDVEIPEATKTKFFEPVGPALATVVIWHGFTNAPSQFAEVGEHLAEQGMRVLLPRMPYHGQVDKFTDDLAKLSPEILIDHAQSCVDLAVGFGDPVWVVGLSAGATLAAWVAATRKEVRRLVLAAPLVAPKGLPLPVVRFFVRYPRLLPKIYFWWDPRKKAELGHSPYAYPGFPLRGIMPYLHMSEALFDGSMRPNHSLERSTLTDNPGDLAIRRDAAKSFLDDVFCPLSDHCDVAHFDPGLKWMHDFVDPYSPNTGTTQQVSEILQASLGTGNPRAGGVLVPPYVDQ